MTIKFQWKIPKIPLFNPSAANALFDKQIHKTLNTMTETVRTNIVWSAPAGATGLLKKIGTSVSGSKGKVFTTVNYAAVIEVGRRAAPVSAKADKSLTDWLRQTRKGRRMLIIARNFMMKKRKSKPSTVQVIKSALFLLKRSMKRKKRKANPFFARGVKRSEKRLRLESGILLRKLAQGLMR